MKDRSKKIPQVLDVKELAQGRLFRLEQVQLQFSNGRQANYERLQCNFEAAVLVVPVLADGTVLLIREYAAGVHRYELALPKGRIEPEEDILHAANRELMEEVGRGARDLRYIKSVTAAPGYVGYPTHIVLARDLYPKKEEGDEPEEIEVIPWDIRKLDQLLEVQECTEARSLAALYITRDILNKENCL